MEMLELRQAKSQGSLGVNGFLNPRVETREIGPGTTCIAGRHWRVRSRGCITKLPPHKQLKGISPAIDIIWLEETNVILVVRVNSPFT